MKRRVRVKKAKKVEKAKEVVNLLNVNNQCFIVECRL